MLRAHGWKILGLKVSKLFRFTISDFGIRVYLNLPKPTFSLFRRVPINSILGFIIRTDKKVGFGSLR